MSDIGTVSLDAFGSFVGPASLRFYIAAFIVEIIFFAAFVATYAIGTWILLRAHPQTRRRRSHIILLAANTLMFLLAATHLALDILVASHGFFHLSSGVEAAKFMLYVSQTLVGDGFMIYRVYKVYQSKWPVIIVPAVLCVIDGIVGYTSTFLGTIGFYMSVGFYSLSLFINIICTVLIMWRVFRLSRELQGVYPKGSKLKIWKVIEATVQSTAIYSAASVSLVITFVNSTTVGYPTCLNVFPALIGLVFSSIVIRIALNSTRDDLRPDSTLNASSTGRQTFASTTPCLEHQEHPALHRILASTTSRGSARRTDSGTDTALDIVLSKVESEESLPLSPLSFEDAEKELPAVRSGRFRT